MNRLHIATVLSAILISGAVVAQDVPGPQDDKGLGDLLAMNDGPGPQEGCPFGQQRGPGEGRAFMQQRRGMQGGMQRGQGFNRQRGMQDGPQQGFRGQRGGQGMGGMGMNRPGKGGPHGERGKGPSPELLKEAGATDEQLAQLKKIREEEELKQVDLKAAAEKAQLKFRQLMSSEKLDQDAIFAAIDEVSAARTQLMKNGISAKIKARDIIGEEVAKKVRELAREKHKAMRGEKPRRGRGGDDAPPENKDV